MNFNPDEYDNSSAIEIFGCTDPSAMNFNPDANIDNGSCDYEIFTNIHRNELQPEAMLIMVLLL